MTSQVLYRKWRPQTLAELVGQEHVTQTLSNALKTGRIAHAYLFCGPRGTGKTSTARILAKAVNCLSDGEDRPCNTCRMCQAITEGRALDLIEIDAASNRGIDEIRDLREKVNFSPNEAKFKLYIIDEVHMLTEPAFNALLKTLEEPPAHAIFILATTEVHKIPATIMSRCQRFDFRRISQGAVVKRLEQVCEKEGIAVNTSALGLIAKSATGSLRDAENLLEQLIIQYGNEIGLPQVQVVLGITGDWRIRELARHLFGGDVAGGLTTINSISNDGLDLRQFNREFVDYLREVLLVKSGAEGSVGAPPEELAEVKALAETTTIEEILKAIRLFGQLDLRFEPQATLPLELAFVECTLPRRKKTSSSEAPVAEAPASEVEVSADVGEKLEQPEEEEAIAEAESPGSDETAQVPPAPSVSDKTAQASPTPSVAKEIPQASPAPSVAEEIPQAAPAPLPENIEHLRQHWNEVIKGLKGMGSKGNLDAFLRSACEPVGVEDGTVVLGFYYRFHMERIEDPKYRHMVEKKVSEVLGSPYKVRCVLTPKEKKARPQPVSQGHLVEAAREMGARVVDVEER